MFIILTLALWTSLKTLYGDNKVTDGQDKCFTWMACDDTDSTSNPFDPCIIGIPLSLCDLHCK